MFMEALLGFKIEDEEVNKNINSLLILQAIDSGKNSSKFSENYIRKLTSFDRKKALTYLNYGLTDSFFEK